MGIAHTYIYTYIRYIHTYMAQSHESHSGRERGVFQGPKRGQKRDFLGGSPQGPVGGKVLRLGFTVKQPVRSSVLPFCLFLFVLSDEDSWIDVRTALFVECEKAMKK